MGRNILFLLIYLLDKYFLSVYYNVRNCAGHWDIIVNMSLSLPSRSVESRAGRTRNWPTAIQNSKGLQYGKRAAGEHKEGKHLTCPSVSVNYMLLFPPCRILICTTVSYNLINHFTDILSYTINQY